MGPAYYKMGGVPNLNTHISMEVEGGGREFFIIYGTRLSEFRSGVTI